MQGPYRIFTLIFFFVYSLSSVVTAQTIPMRSGYAPVNGLKMYYEIHGSDSLAAPLVLIHGGGSTIITFSQIFVPLAGTSRAAWDEN